MNADPFSTEVPELLKLHLEHLRASAISLEVIRERGYVSVLGKKPLQDAGFSKAQQRVPGILIPLHGVDGSVIGHQYRPDRPRLNAKERPIKYENPAGSSVRIDAPPRCREALGNPGVPLWITEGVKKGDALATAGACAIGLTGVWGFKGKNLMGGITLLADWDHIALKDRLAYLVFDSDSASNPQVRLALNRLTEHLTRKAARVRIISLPPGPDGEKVGADDYLAQGHALDDLVGLEVIDDAAVAQTLKEKSAEQYCTEAGRYCWSKQTPNGPVDVALCNFTAKVTEDVLKDNGQEVSRVFRIIGNLCTGQDFPPIEVTSSNFNSLNWVTGEWGMKAIIAAGQNNKDRLREAIQLQSQDALQRVVYTHTGWREVDGQITFLSSGGALDNPNVGVELDSPLRRYSLPEPRDDPREAIRASFEFLFVGNLEVVLPIWTAMYLAPLSEILEPAFSLWLVGPSGAFKSTVTALALCHYGDFDYLHLPASWRDTANQLEKLLFLCKDVPLVIDDWAPGHDSAKARELEVKAEYVIRAQGNRQGRGRMRSDTSSRPIYTPRGLLITSGEQLPSGHSHTARIYSVEIEPADIDLTNLTRAQEQRHMYRVAMAHYLLWLKRQWDTLRPELKATWYELREKAHSEEGHPRLPEVIAWLYCGLNLATSFAHEAGAITASEMETLRNTGWEIFLKLASTQRGRIEEERPGKRFIEALGALLDQGRAVLWDKEDEAPRTPIPGTTSIGWRDGDECVLLNPPAAYSVVHEFCQRSGAPFTFKESAVWKDLVRLGYITIQSGRNTEVAKIYGQSKRVLKLKKSSLYARAG